MFRDWGSNIEPSTLNVINIGGHREFNATYSKAGRHRRSRLGRQLCQDQTRHERFCEKEDCGYSKSAVGEGSKFETDHGFC